MACPDHTVLSMRKNLSITRHRACGHITLRYQNIVLNFGTDDFNSFSSIFQKLDFERQAARFPDGRLRMVMHTCRREVQLCFERDEFQQLRRALREASVMLEVHEILHPDHPR